MLFTFAAGWLLVLHALGRSMNHDEHQFLAPAALLSREGLLPYRDFPLFHLPNSVALYAFLDWCGMGLIDGAKMANTVATIGLVGLLFVIARRKAGDEGSVGRCLLAMVAGLFLLCDPLFLYTSGKTWNHEIPAFLLVLAAVFHVETFPRQKRWIPFFIGLLAGLAVGFRLTYLFPAGAFFLHTLFSGRSREDKIQILSFWTAGFGLALLPSLYTYLRAPEAFIFDNLRFPRLRTLEPGNTRIQQTMAWSNKLRFLAKEVLTRSWPLVLAWLALHLWPYFRRNRAPAIYFNDATRFFGLLIPLALIGAFAPSRYQYQHLYVLPVLLAAGGLYATDRIRLGWRALTAVTFCLVGAQVLGLTKPADGDEDRRNNGWRAYANSLEAMERRAWFSHKYRRQFVGMTKILPAGSRVLTLASTVPLINGFGIYSDFATGVFAWRSATYVPPEKRRRLGFVAPDDLESLYAPKLPPGILTGVEDPKWETELVRFAGRHGYQEVKLPKSAILWVAPGVMPDGVAR